MAYEIDLASMADPFQVPAAWLPDDAGGVIQELIDPIAETFRATHRLNAVMAHQQGGYAIVDGRRLRIGQEIDGFELIEIRVRSIVLESPPLRVELSLLDAAGSGVTRPAR